MNAICMPNEWRAMEMWPACLVGPSLRLTVMFMRHAKNLRQATGNVGPASCRGETEARKRQGRTFAGYGLEQLVANRCG